MVSITELHPTLPLGAMGTPIKARLKCADGFMMSVQASSYHYCTPRVDAGPHINFEIGFPTEREELLMPYAEEPNRPTETVYGYVPADIVDQVIAKHGGYVEERA